MLKRNRHLDASVTRFEEVIPGFFSRDQTKSHERL